jgi:hypothetical protein
VKPKLFAAKDEGVQSLSRQAIACGEAFDGTNG